MEKTAGYQRGDGNASCLSYEYYRLMSRTPDYYRMKAEENRTIAEGIADESARIALLGVADQYDELARQAQRHINEARH